MPIIFRIDIDIPYGWETIPQNIMDYLRLNWYFPAITKLGYLKYLYDLVEDLNSYEISATFFLRCTCIPKNLMIFKKHELELHAENTINYKNFLKEINFLSMKIKKRILGFSKHGSGTKKLSRRHDYKYEPRKYIKWAKQAGLKYFSGNGNDPKEMPHQINDITFYPSAFWLNKAVRSKDLNIDWLISESERREIVVLMHPYNWGTVKQIRRDYEIMINKIDKFVTFIQAIKYNNKIHNIADSY